MFVHDMARLRGKDAKRRPKATGHDTDLLGAVSGPLAHNCLEIIMRHYRPDASPPLSPHLILEVEPMPDGVIFLDRGHLVRQGPTSPSDWQAVIPAAYRRPCFPPLCYCFSPQH